MRKFKVLAVALVIGTASLFAASATNLDDAPAKEVRSQILELLETPDFNVDQDTTVYIMFTFNSEGEIVVLDVDSKNSEILNYVRKNINHKVIANPGTRDKLYSMPLTVKKG